MFYYGVDPAANQTTNATPNTENDAFFVAPGAGRTLFITSAMVTGKGAALTSLSGIVQRIKTWTSTASSGGTPIVPAKMDNDSPASKATAGFSASAVTSGTGGPSVKQAFGCSGAAPGFWNTLRNLDEAVVLESAATMSCDFFNASGTASLNFELSVTIAE